MKTVTAMKAKKAKKEINRYGLVLAVVGIVVASSGGAMTLSTLVPSETDRGIIFMNRSAGMTVGRLYSYSLVDEGVQGMKESYTFSIGYKEYDYFTSVPMTIYLQGAYLWTSAGYYIIPQFLEKEKEKTYDLYADGTGFKLGWVTLALKRTYSDPLDMFTANATLIVIVNIDGIDYKTTISNEQVLGSWPFRKKLWFEQDSDNVLVTFGLGANWISDDSSLKNLRVINKCYDYWGGATYGYDGASCEFKIYIYVKKLPDKDGDGVDFAWDIDDYNPMLLGKDETALLVSSYFITKESLATLRAEYNTLFTDYKALEKSRDALLAEINALNIINTELVATISAQNQVIYNKNLEIQNLSSQIALKNQEIDELNERLRLGNIQLDEYNVRISALNAELQQIALDLNVTRGDLVALNTRLAEITDVLNRGLVEVNRTYSEITNLDIENAVLLADMVGNIDTIKTNLDEQLRDIDALLGTIDAYKVTLNGMDFGSASGLKTEIVSYFDALRSSVVGLREKVVTTKLIVLILESELNRASEIQVLMSEKITYLGFMIGKQYAAIENLNLTVAQQAVELAGLEREIAALSVKLAEQKLLLEENARVIANQGSLIAEQKLKIAGQAGLITEQQRAIAEQKVAIESQRARILNLEETLQKAISAANALVAKLVKDIDDLTARNVELDAELAKYKDRGQKTVAVGAVLTVIGLAVAFL